MQAGGLDVTADWAAVLSNGEQQRVGLDSYEVATIGIPHNINESVRR